MLCGLDAQEGNEFDLRPARDLGPGYRRPQGLNSAVFPRALKEKGEGRFLDP